MIEAVSPTQSKCKILHLNTEKFRITQEFIPIVQYSAQKQTKIVTKCKMKTPLQQLLDDTTELLHTFDSEERVAMAVLDYLKTNKKAMLEKEKEQMRLVHKNGYDNSQYIHDCKYGGVEYWDSVPKPFEEYYNETFNTKEK